MEVPIIILNWNGFADTIECMESIRLTDGINYHIFLVDNNSDQDQGLLLKQIFEPDPRVTVILNDQNLGFTTGNNIVIQQLLNNKEYKYVVLLNNDTVVSPTWLKALVTCAEKNGSDIVSSKMIDYYDRSIMDNAGHYMLNTGEILPLGHRQPISNYNFPFENLGGCGGAVLYSAPMLRTIGVFDDFFDTGYEDAEFGLRAKLCGYKCLYAPDAVVYHKVSRSIKKIRDNDYFIRVQRNILYTYVKLMPDRFLALHMFWIGFKYILFGILGILLLRLKMLKHHIRTLNRFFRYDFRAARKARSAFYCTFNIKYQNPTNFFLKTDLKRLIRFIKGGIIIE